jgi:hypothetical protein
MTLLSDEENGYFKKDREIYEEDIIYCVYLWFIRGMPG